MKHILSARVLLVQERVSNSMSSLLRGDHSSEINAGDAVKYYNYRRWTNDVYMYVIL